MTYCVGIAVNSGFVMVSDSRTNAGPDNVSAYSKMRSYGIPGQCQFVITSAGNLATTQSVYTAIERDIRKAETTNLLTMASVDDAALYIGKLSRKAQKEVTGGGAMFESSFLIAGEVQGDQHRLMLVYAAGNHIASSRQTPYLQIGETKYGEPILDRILTMDSTLDQICLCALVSMDSTMRSNVSVAPPIEVYVHQAGSIEPGRHAKFLENDAYLATLKTSWDHHLMKAFGDLPAIAWPEFESS